MIEMIIWWETRLFLSNGNLGSVRISRVPVVIGRSLFLYMDILSNSSKMLVSIDQTYNRGFMSTKLIVLILENQYAHCPFIGTGVDLSWDHGYWFWYRSTPVHRVELHPNDRIVRSVLDRAFHLHLVNWLWEIVQNVFFKAFQAFIITIINSHLHQYQRQSPAGWWTRWSAACSGPTPLWPWPGEATTYCCKYVFLQIFVNNISADICSGPSLHSQMGPLQSHNSMVIRVSCVCDAFWFQDNVILNGSLLWCKQHYRHSASHWDFFRSQLKSNWNRRGGLSFKWKTRECLVLSQDQLPPPAISCLPVEQACLPGPSPNLS